MSDIEVITAAAPIRVEISGAQGPNVVSATTATDLTGILKGDGSTVSVVGGTSDEFIKGDGSLDDTQYLTPENLATTLQLYPTSAASDIGGYYAVVKDVEDADYDDVAVAIPTGAISGTDQLIASGASDAGLIVGNPGYINVTVVGQIRKLTGAAGTNATFHFALYQRNAAGTESLIGVSSESRLVSDALYEEYQANLVFQNGVWLATDRIVVKFYGTKVGTGVNPTYDFQFGGLTPVRVVVPAPVQVLLSGYSPVGHTHVSADVTDATSDAVTNPQKLLKTTASGSLHLGELEIGEFYLGGDPVPVVGVKFNHPANNKYAYVSPESLTDDRSHGLPNASGTLALTAQTDGTILASDLNVSGSTDIGTALVDADEIIVGTKKSAMSRVKTYIAAWLDTALTIAGAKTWSGAQTINADLTVDTNVLKVDTVNNRVGIGTAAPDAPLHINGAGNLSLRVSTATASDSQFQFYSDNIQRCLIGYGAGGIRLVDPSNAFYALYSAYNSGKVGIGTTSPATMLTLGSTGSLSFKDNSGTWNGATLAGDQSFSGVVTFSSKVKLPVRTPSSATDTGTAGEVVTDANYIYVCTATNTWKRTAITTW